MKIIDAHLHLFSEDSAEEMARQVGHHNNVDHLREVYGELHIAHGVVMGNHSLELRRHDYPTDLFHYCVGLDSLVLPAVTVGFGLAALITRTTRSSMLDVLRQDYMTTARAKGCSEKQVITVHGLKNALIPIITYLGNHMAGIIGGASIVETIFAIPGIGSYAIAGVQSKDYYVVQAYVLFSGCIYVLTNILIDLIYIALDPKIRAGEAVES